MEKSTNFYVQKALIDTQERIRDYMNYSEQIQDKNVSDCFREFAEVEGRHAQTLQGFL